MLCKPENKDWEEEKKRNKYAQISVFQFRQQNELSNQQRKK